jgi:acyl-CoA thioesterase FadM
MGAGVADYQNRGTLMALSELNIKFKAPLRSGDAFRVETAVEQVGGGLG